MALLFFIEKHGHWISFGLFVFLLIAFGAGVINQWIP